MTEQIKPHNIKNNPNKIPQNQKGINNVNNNNKIIKNETGIDLNQNSITIYSQNKKLNIEDLPNSSSIRPIPIQPNKNQKNIIKISQIQPQSNQATVEPIISTPAVQPKHHHHKKKEMVQPNLNKKNIKINNESDECCCTICVEEFCGQDTDNICNKILCCCGLLFCLCCCFTNNKRRNVRKRPRRSRFRF